MGEKIKVGLLFGGPSPEHKISIESARMVFYSLKTDHNREKYAIYPFYISESGYFNQFNQMRYASPGIPPEKKRGPTGDSFLFVVDGRHLPRYAR